MSRILKVDGYDDCALGGVLQKDGVPPRLIYDANKIIQKMVQDDRMSEEDAQEFFEFNTLGSYMGEGTPWFLYPVDEDGIQDTEDLAMLPKQFDAFLLGTLSGCAVETSCLYNLGPAEISQHGLTVSDKGPFFLVYKNVEEDLDEWVDKYLEGGAQ